MNIEQIKTKYDLKNLHDADLRGADLHGADLRGADLYIGSRKVTSIL